MKATTILLTLALSAGAQTQITAPSITPGPNSRPAPIPRMPANDLSPLLSQIQQTAQGINLDITRLRIEKWKANASVKRQAQANADSITRNLTAAFPAILDQARANPGSLAASFKLYRNLDALYDVFSGLAEATGAFGPKGESQQMNTDANALGQLRRTLGDQLESLAAGTDNELVHLRSMAAEVTAAPPPPPKKIIVDDEEKPKKSTRKKPAKKPEANPPAASPNP